MAPFARRALVVASSVSALRYGVASGAGSCPRDEPGCLGDVDEGSLLQMGSQRRTVVLDATKDGVRDSVCPQVGARGWFSTKAFDYVKEKVFPFAINDVESPALPVDPISGESSGMKYLIDNMQLHAVGAQATNIQLVEGKGIQFSMSGLTAAVTMRYDIASTGWFKFAAKGNLSAEIGAGTSVSLFIAFGTDETGNPKTTPEDLKVQIKISDLQFKGADAGTTALIQALSGVVKPIIEQQAQAAVVEAVNQYLNSDVNSLIAGFDFGIPMKGDTPEPWSVAMKVCSVQITSSYIVADLYAAVEGTDVYPDSPESLLPTSSESMSSSMFGAAVAEWTVNGALWFVQKSNLMNASISDPEVPESAGNGISFSGYTALDLHVVAPPSVDFIDTGFNQKLDAQLALVQADDTSAEVSVVTPVSIAATYTDGEAAFKISADGEPRDLHVGTGAPSSSQGKDASFWSSLLVDTANENVENMVDQLMSMNSDGSKGLQIKDQQLHFTDEAATAFANIEVDIKKLIESFLGADSASHLLTAR